MSTNVGPVVEPIALRSYNFSSKGNAFIFSGHVIPAPSFVHKSFQKSDFNLETSWDCSVSLNRTALVRLFSIDRSGSFHQTDGPRWKSDCRQGNGFCRSSVLVSKSHSLACNLPLCCLRAARNNSGPEFQTCLAPRWGGRFPAQLEIFLFLCRCYFAAQGSHLHPDWEDTSRDEWIMRKSTH